MADKKQFFKYCQEDDQASLRELIFDAHSCKKLMKQRMPDTDDTGLHVAAKYGHAVVVRMLIDHQAEINVVNAQGDTPLRTAVEHGQAKVVSVLLEKGAHFSQRDLVHAIKHNQFAIARSLLRHAKKTFDKDHYQAMMNDLYDGASPLYHACQIKNLDMIRYLLKHGANPNQETAKGDTPFKMITHQFATRFKHSAKGWHQEEQVLQLLLDNGAKDDNARQFHFSTNDYPDLDGTRPERPVGVNQQTFLNYVIHHGLTRITESLLQHQQYTPCELRTACCRALSQKRFDIAYMILQYQPNALKPNGYFEPYRSSIYPCSESIQSSFQDYVNLISQHQGDWHKTVSEMLKYYDSTNNRFFDMFSPRRNSMHDLFIQDEKQPLDPERMLFQIEIIPHRHGYGPQFDIASSLIEMVTKSEMIRASKPVSQADVTKAVEISVSVHAATPS